MTFVTATGFLLNVYKLQKRKHAEVRTLLITKENIREKDTFLANRI